MAEDILGGPSDTLGEVDTSTFELVARKNQASGYAGLDVNGKVPWASLAGPVINVKDTTYAGGAQGDGVATTGSMSSSVNPTWVTLNTGTVTSANIGQKVYVSGAGAAGAYLSTTIASIQSGSIAVLASPALTTVSGAEVRYGSGDSTAVAAAFAAIPSSGGVVVFPTGTYLWDGIGGLVPPNITGHLFITGYSATILETPDGPEFLKFNRQADFDYWQNTTVEGFSVDGGGALLKGTSLGRHNVVAGFYNGNSYARGYRVNVKNVHFRDIHSYNAWEDPDASALVAGNTQAFRGHYFMTPGQFMTLVPPIPCNTLASQAATPTVSAPANGGAFAATGTYRAVLTAVDARGETIASTEVSYVITDQTQTVAIPFTVPSGMQGNASNYRFYRSPAGGATGSEDHWISIATSGSGSASSGSGDYRTYTFTDTGAAGTAGTPPVTNTAKDTLVSVTNLTFDDCVMDGGVSGIAVGAQARNSGFKTDEQQEGAGIECFYDRIFIRRCSHTATVIQKSSQGSSFIVGSWAYGEYIEITDCYSGKSSDTAYEIDGYMDCHIRDCIAEDAGTTAFFFYNFHVPIDHDRQNLVVEGCKHRVVNQQPMGLSSSRQMQSVNWGGGNRGLSTGNIAIRDFLYEGIGTGAVAEKLDPNATPGFQLVGPNAKHIVLENFRVVMRNVNGINVSGGSYNYGVHKIAPGYGRTDAVVSCNIQIRGCSVDLSGAMDAGNNATIVFRPLAPGGRDVTLDIDGISVSVDVTGAATNRFQLICVAIPYWSGSNVRGSGESLRIIKSLGGANPTGWHFTGTSATTDSGFYLKNNDYSATVTAGRVVTPVSIGSPGLPGEKIFLEPRARGNHVTQGFLVPSLSDNIGQPNTNFTQVANSGFVVRFVVENTITISNISVGVSTAATANDSIDVAIYDRDWNRLVSSGPTAGKVNTGGAHIATVAITATQLQPGVYYAGLAYGAVGGTAAKFDYLSYGGSKLGYQAWGTSPPDIVADYNTTVASGTLPNPWVLGNNGSNIPYLFIS